MNKEKEYFDDDYRIPSTGIDLLREGSDALVISTGSELNEVMKASDILYEDGIHITVINVFSIKPFDSEFFLKCVKGFKHVFSVEEHNTIGGLGSMVLECLYSGGIDASVIKIGLQDGFTKGYGDIDSLRKLNGLDAQTIATIIRRNIK